MAVDSDSIRQGLENGDVTRHPFWLESGGSPVAAWLHMPSGDRLRSAGVVLCPPVGFEYSHAYRSLLQLGDALARRGFVTLRLDYPGTGNSAGDETAPALVASWVGSVEDAMSFVHTLAPDPPILIGLRVGALIAGEALRRRPASGWVAWAPYVQGRHFAREARMLHLVGDEEAVHTPGFLDAGGFRFADETMSSLGAIRLDRGDDLGETPLLVIDREGQPAADRLAQHAEAGGSPVDRLVQADFDDMMAEPQYTVVPRSTIDGIVDWCAASVSGTVDGPLQSIEALHRTQVSVTDRDGVVIGTESLLLIDGSDTPLFGVLLEPAEVDRSSANVVVLPNAGSVHTAGPNRLYVELARELMRAGVPSLRFDLRNLGDSLVGAPSDENHPYPEGAVDDVRAAIELVERAGYPGVVAAGLCSGAHTALHAAVELVDQPIRAHISVNPLTFGYEPGTTLDTPATYQGAKDASYYRRAFWDPERWRRLLSGDSDLKYILSFMGKRFAERVSTVMRHSGQRVGLSRGTPFARRLRKLEELDRRICFVFADTDPGPEMLTKEGGPTATRLARDGFVKSAFVTDADHTFSRKGPRAEAIAEVVEHVRPDLALQRIHTPPRSDMWDHIEEDWRRLLDATGETSAFLSPEWTRAWLAHPDAAGNTSAVRWTDNDGRVVGMLLGSRGSGKTGPFSVRRSFFNGPPGSAARPEHNDVLTIPEHRTAIVRDLARMLLSIPSDDVGLVGVRPGLLDPLVARVRGSSWDGYESHSPYVDLTEVRKGGGEYLAVLSANARSQVRRSLRLYEERFGARGIRVADSAAEAQTWFDEMVTIHDARRHALGSHSEFTPTARAFHRDLIERVFGGSGSTALAAHMLRVEFGGETVGILYHLAYRNRVYYYQGGLRYHEDNRLKPGLVSHSLVLQHYLEHGADEYDFLGGEPEPVRYKETLSTNHRILHWGEMSLPTRKMKLIRGLRLVRRVLRGDGSSDD
ncbi:MAG: GNAT family N-acetyltransferase [Gemmatimonadota bacterium]